MASPQVEHGFVQIALDLHVAIMTADLPNRCSIVLAEVLLRCYGPAKESSVWLDPANLEDLTGLHRNNARRGINELVEFGLIRREPDGSFTFIKDYETWTVNRERLDERLGGGLLRFVRSALTRFGKTKNRINRSKKDAIPPDSISTPGPIPLDSGKSNHLNPTGFRYSQPPESNGIATDANIKNRDNDTSPSLIITSGDSLACAHTHAIVRAPGDLREEEKREKASNSRATPRKNSLHESGYQAAPTRLQQAASVDGSLPGDIVPDEAMLALVQSRAEEWFPCDHGLTNAIGLHRRQFTAAWMLKVMKRLKLKGASSPSGLFRKILIDWRNSGGPDRGPEDEYDDELRLLKPSERKPDSRPSAPGRSSCSPLPPRKSEIDERRRQQLGAGPATAPEPPKPGNVPSGLILERLGLSRGKESRPT